MRCAPGGLLAAATVCVMLGVWLLAAAWSLSEPPLPAIETDPRQTPVVFPTPRPSPTMVPFLTHGSPVPRSLVRVSCLVSVRGCTPTVTGYGP